MKLISWIGIDRVTIVGGAVVAVFMYFGPLVDERIRRATKIVLNTVLLCLILISSYQILTSPLQMTKVSDFLLLLDKQTLFFLVVLLKLAVVFWIVMFVMCYFHPERITKAQAKVGNFEVSQEFADPEKIISITEGSKRVFQQIKIITRLNRTVLDFIAQPFEVDILKAENIPDAIRGEVHKTLCEVYKRYLKIKIYVMELTEGNLTSLEPTLYSRIKRRWDEAVHEGEDVGYVEEDIPIGIAVHRGTEGLSTAIIIDASQQKNYELSNAELAAASTLFVAVSSNISILAMTKYSDILGS